MFIYPFFILSHLKPSTQLLLLQPLCADMFPDDLDYADVDFHTYGPINYKDASIYALLKKNKNGNLTEIRK